MGVEVVNHGLKIEDINTDMEEAKDNVVGGKD